MPQLGSSAPSSRIALVDPYDSGSLYAPALRERGALCWRIESNPWVPESVRGRLDESLFEASHIHRDLGESLEVLRHWRVDRVVAGSETGVLLADRLSAALGLPGNGTALSVPRRDKAAMAVTAAAAGLAVPAQAVSGDPDVLVRWARDHDRWPVVVKPVDSLDSDGVRLCANENEIASAADELLGRRNRAGQTNERLIVQETLTGPQYVVDTVSLDGDHHLATLWRYTRPQRAREWLDEVRDRRQAPDADGELRAYAAIGSDGKQILPADGQRHRRLVDYTFALLDALGVRHGPAHCELVWEREGHPDEGPRLMEIGIRLHGAPRTHWLTRLCAGRDQVELAVDALLDPGAFRRKVAERYHLARHGRMVRLTPWRTGTLRRFRRLDEVRALPSFHEVVSLGEPGPLRRVMGVIALLHPDADGVERDAARIRALEAEGLYELATPPDEVRRSSNR